MATGLDREKVFRRFSIKRLLCAFGVEKISPGRRDHLRKSLLPLNFEMRIWNPYAMEGVDNCVAVYSSDGMVKIWRWAGKSGFKVFNRK